MKARLIERLEKELMALDHELKIDLPRALKEAAAHGDLSENAEYDAAKERKRVVESRISMLQHRISQIIAIDFNAIPRDKVGLGSLVKLENLQSGAIVEYDFVLPEELDPDRGKISLASPIGKALVGKQEGDEVIIALPKGRAEYEIVELITLDRRSDAL